MTNSQKAYARSLDVSPGSADRRTLRAGLELKTGREIGDLEIIAGSGGFEVRADLKATFLWRAEKRDFFVPVVDDTDLVAGAIADNATATAYPADHFA